MNLLDRRQHYSSRGLLQPTSFHHVGSNTSPKSPSLSPKPTLNSKKKINKSCLECRRRKIRCDGNQPCQKCIYYQIPQCQFYTRKKRKFSSQRYAYICNLNRQNRPIWYDLTPHQISRYNNTYYHCRRSTTIRDNLASRCHSKTDLPNSLSGVTQEIISQPASPIVTKCVTTSVEL